MGENGATMDVRSSARNDKMNAATPESKGVCQRCSEHIAFPATMQGENVACPHCGRETTLAASISPNMVHKAENDGRRASGISGVAILLAYKSLSLLFLDALQGASGNG